MTLWNAESLKSIGNNISKYDDIYVHGNVFLAANHSNAERLVTVAWNSD